MYHYCLGSSVSIVGTNPDNQRIMIHSVRSIVFDLFSGELYSKYKNLQEI